MYTVSDAVEMGNAQEVILSVGPKAVESLDDSDPNTYPGEEYFDE